MHIEIDFKLVVVNTIDRSNNHLVFDIMNICRAMLQQNPNFTISFVRKQTNYVAHNLTSKLYVRYQIFDLILFCNTTIMMNEIT